MKIMSVRSLVIEAVKVLEFGAFNDDRGYFEEVFRQQEVAGLDGFTPFFEGIAQINQSHSHKGVMRGLHFQWNPPMGKLVRTLRGHMVDMVVDLRKSSLTFGKGIMHDMPDSKREWIWVPPGMAHGNFFLEETDIEYLCTGAYNPECEAGICPFPDIDWSLVDFKLKTCFRHGIDGKAWKMSNKDRNGMTLGEWLTRLESDYEVFRFKEKRPK